MKKLLSIVVVAVFSLMLLGCDKKAGIEGKVVDSVDKPKPESKESEYLNKEFGISFIIPKGLKLFTAEELASRSQELSNALEYQYSADFEDFILSDPASAAGQVDPPNIIRILITKKMARKDSLAGLKEIKEKKPNVFPAYSNISVTLITIGKEKKMKAVEHIWLAKSFKNREISFFHQGRGFIFVCTSASADAFEKGNRELFTPLLESMDYFDGSGIETSSKTLKKK